MNTNRSVAPMKTAKVGYIVLSILFCVLGVLIIVWPDSAMAALNVALGVCMILFGVVKIIGYFSKDLYRLAFQYDLAFGVLLVALGAITLARPKLTLNTICVMLGVSLLADGLFRVQMALDARRFGIRRWWLILALAVLLGVFGTLMLLDHLEGARALTILLGLGLIGEGALNLCVAVSAVKIVHNQQRDETGV